ncbi:uncharacterized protein LOC119501293 isoform X2 [Sebastes umbrosus]|uniref:uncharacterized protein LOC119501293 isoform X2 n=1 Tax=Sebastes umbrosus TaxID=72105 RepID=UPI00189FB235|nr:uncharacterized protein LOC119501293 isoform X2 [Sebastes umbrosus]
MMKMSGRVTSCCVALFFVLNSVSAVQRDLDSINDLKQINFGQSVPTHILLLLHWFANTVDIDDNNNIIRLTFDPNSGDYGSHYYGNFEELLDPLHRGSGYRYYTVGNLHQETSMPLPPYVVRPPREYEGTNRDRIIIRIREQNTGGQALPRIYQVYITQHYDTSENQGTRYDPDHTYKITVNLLRQIREFYLGQNQQQLLQLRNRYGSSADELHIRNTWGDLACLGLLLFIVIEEKSSTSQQNNRPQNRRTHLDNNESESESNVPRSFRNQGYVALDMNDDEDHETNRRTGNRQSGRNNASVPLNNDQESFCCIWWICCFSSILLIALCVILFYLYKDQLT